MPITLQRKNGSLPKPLLKIKGDASTIEALMKAFDSQKTPLLKFANS